MLINPILHEKGYFCPNFARFWSQVERTKFTKIRKLLNKTKLPSPFSLSLISDQVQNTFNPILLKAVLPHSSFFRNKSLQKRLLFHINLTLSQNALQITPENFELLR